MISGPGLQKVLEYLTPDKMGTITAINAHHYRNAPYGGWMRKIPADCDAQHVDWDAFQGEAQKYPFDPQRYRNWRFFWDYSGGNVFENMIHQVGLLVQGAEPADPGKRDDDRGQLPCPADAGAGHDECHHAAAGEDHLQLELDVRERLLRRGTRSSARHEGDGHASRIRPGPLLAAG